MMNPLYYWVIKLALDGEQLLIGFGPYIHSYMFPNINRNNGQVVKM